MSYAEAPQGLFTELGLDIDALLAPLPEGEGGGVDMRYRPEMDALAEVRRADDDSDQGIWKTEAKKADWNALIRLGTGILERQSKDLQVAVWLCQGLANRDGLKGLGAGLELLARLTAEFWPGLWPRPDGDDLDPRLAPYFWIDTQLTSEVMKLEVTEPAGGERSGVSFQQLIRAQKLQQLASNNSRAYEEAVAEGEISLDEITDLMRRTSGEFFVRGLGEARVAAGALWRLGKALDKGAGSEAPSFSNLARGLRDLEQVFAQVVADRGLDRRQDAPAPVAAEEPGAAGAPARRLDFEMIAGVPTISSRRAAYALLEYAAEWLLEHEPHSPAPYLVKRAVSWENLSLRDLLSELMARGADPDAIFDVLGIGGEEQAGAPRRRRMARVLDD